VFASISVITSPDTSIADLGNKVFVGSIAAFTIIFLVSLSVTYVLNTPKAWRNRGQAGVRQLISEVEHGQREDRVAAAKMLGKLGDAQAVDALIQALHDPDRSVYLSAARTLGRLGDPALEPLLHALQDKDSHVRLGAALALRASGDERAVEPLRRALADPDGTVRAVAAWTMGEFKDEQALPVLLQMQQNDTALDHEGHPVKDAASYAIRCIRRP
jgi:bilin biosynthesis protein